MKKTLLAIAASVALSATAATWQPIESMPGSGGAWKKLCPAKTAPGTWAKMGACPFEYNVVISAATLNFNIRDGAIAAGWDQVKPLEATITIETTGVVASDTNTCAFSTGTGFPSGSYLEVVNKGVIVGRSGYYESSMTKGNGGNAFCADAQVVIHNQGIIGGGGGMGGKGGDGTRGRLIAFGPPGGTGAGYTSYVNASSCGPFTLTTGGTGCDIRIYYADTGVGGSGGDIGQPGKPGTDGYRAGGQPGLPGYAIVGFSNVTWALQGAVYGPTQ